MENVPTNLYKSWQNCNFGLIWAVSGPLGAPPCRKIFFLTGSFKLWPILKVCTVLKNVLTKTPKIIRRKKEKEHFGPILTILGKMWVTVILKILKLKVTLFDQVIHWNNVFYFIKKMLWYSEVIADFVKSIFSLIREGVHFLAKTEAPTLSRSYKNVLRLFWFWLYNVRCGISFVGLLKYEKYGPLGYLFLFNSPLFISIAAIFTKIQWFVRSVVFPIFILLA